MSPEIYKRRWFWAIAAIAVVAVVTLPFLIREWLEPTVPPEKPAPDSSTVPHYIIHLNDHLGSTTLVIDQNANVVEQVSYSTFGEITYHNPPSPPFNKGGNGGIYLYTGQERDPSDLYDYGARAYDPTLSRFVSVDALRQYFNPYAYSGNNPIRYLDPDGNSYEDSTDLNQIDIGSIPRLYPWDPKTSFKNIPSDAELRMLTYPEGLTIFFLRKRPDLWVSCEWIESHFPDSLTSFDRDSVGGSPPKRDPEIKTVPRFIQWVQDIENDPENHGKNPWDIMKVVRNRASILNLHVVHPGSGIFTDMNHFTRAGRTERALPGFGEIIWLGVEFLQLIPGVPGWWQSALSPLDVHSNAVGIEFIQYFFNPQGPPLSEQLSKYFLYRQVLENSVLVDSEAYQRMIKSRGEENH